MFFLLYFFQVDYKLKTFAGLGIYFVGSNPVVMEFMKKDAIENGAEIVHFEDPACTHMVCFYTF